MDSSVQPIATLNPFLSSFTIKARITSTNYKTYANSNGKGHLGSFSLLDEHGGEIELTLFNQDYDRLSPLLKQSTTCYISNGQIRPNKFSRVKNTYGITGNANTKVNLVSAGDVSSIPSFKLSLTTLEDATHLYNNNNNEGERVSVDLIVVILSISNTETITTKKGSELEKRVCTIVDDSMTSLEYTAWGETCSLLNSVPEKSVIALKGAAVGSFQERVNLNGGSLIKEEELNASAYSSKVKQLKEFIDSVNVSSFKTSHSSSGSSKNNAIKVVDDIERELLGQGDSTDYFDLIGFSRVLGGVVNPVYYDSCMREGCKKKVQPDGNDFMFCGKCQTSSPTSKPEYVFNVNVADFSGSGWVSVFGDVGKDVIGEEAEKVKELKVKEDEEGLKKVLYKNNWELVHFRCGASTQEYNGESRVKVNGFRAEKVDWVKDGYKLLDMIR